MRLEYCGAADIPLEIRNLTNRQLATQPELTLCQKVRARCVSANEDESIPEPRVGADRFRHPVKDVLMFVAKHSARFALVFAITLFTAACDPLDPDPGPGNDWRVVSALSAQAVIGLHGRGNGTVYAVGGRSASSPPLFMVVTRTSVETLTVPAGATGVLRAVATGPGATDPVVAVGDAGLVMRYDPSNGSVATVAGVASDFDLRAVTWHAGAFWIAGRQSVPASDPPEAGVVYRLDGSTFSRESGLPVGAEVGGAFNAIFADSANSLWVAGTTGEILYRTGANWAATPADGMRLNAIGGNGAIVVAVGGRTRATVLESAGNADFRDISPGGAPAFFDVHVAPGGTVTAVGSAGSVWERRGSTWRSLIGTPTTSSDAVGVVVDSDGGIWVIGGHTTTTPYRDGFIWFIGSTVAPTATP